MTDYEFILEDRIAKIKAINEQYDLEHNSYISFSGGKDSTILHYLMDLALPNNKIPRLFLNTGVEYKAIREFVKNLSLKDERIIILNSNVNIKEMLNKYGYPFKSKQHAHNWQIYNNNKIGFSYINEMVKKEPKLLQDTLFIKALPNGIKTNIKYLYGIREKDTATSVDERDILYSYKGCPNSLKYQFDGDFNLNISDKCCYKLKKEVANKWEKESGKSIAITGIRADEGGMRNQNGCTIFEEDKLTKFHPLKVVSKEWEDEFIERNNIQLCELYYPPYNFKRTGCKGCPFALDLNEQLEIMKRLLPNEYKQCEILWKPVYDEYRRIGYRLRKKSEYEQLTIFDL